MICKSCREGGAWNALAQSGATLPEVRKSAEVKSRMAHQSCPGNTRCDCQCKTEKVLREASDGR